MKHTKESIIATARTCKTRHEFVITKNAEYQYARLRGYLDEVYAIFPPGEGSRASRKNAQHTKETTFAAARTCKTRLEFIFGKNAEYQHARRKNYLTEIYNFLPERVGLPPTSYTEDEIVAHAKKYSSWPEWRAADRKDLAAGRASHYDCAQARGKEFMAICRAHMSSSQEPRLKYSDSELIASARKYQHKGAWGLSTNIEDRRMCYAARYRPGVWELATAHMTRKHRRAGRSLPSRDASGAPCPPVTPAALLALP